MSMPETGPRRVPVLLMLDKQEPLVASATAFRERLPRIDIRAAKVPKAVELDPFFPAVPVGPGNRNITLESTAPEASEQFVVRAFVTAEKPEDVPERVDGRQVFADPVIEPLPICPGDPAMGGVPDVKAKLATAKLAASGLDGNKVAIAIVDTGVNLAHLTAKLGGAPRFDAGNSWTPKGVTTLPGNHPVNHGTMCAFDALIAAPNATLLDYPVLVTPAQGGSTMSGTVGVALLAYAQLVVGWAVAFAAGGTQKYSGLVVSNSWGVYHPSWDLPPGHRGRYIDNPNHPFHLQVSALNRSGVDIIFAAGNCGAPCPASKCQNLTTGTIMGANAHADVLTVAGCDVGDQRVGYSSQGPSIANMPQQKPDLTGYTHFLGSAAFGVGSADSGTSAACPIVAGCVAALRTKESPFNTPPADLFAQLRLTARQISGPAGWNADYGHGIVDPVGAGQSLGLIPTA